MLIVYWYWCWCCDTRNSEKIAELTMRSIQTRSWSLGQYYYGTAVAHKIRNFLVLLLLLLLVVKLWTMKFGPFSKSDIDRLSQNSIALCHEFFLIVNMGVHERLHEWLLISCTLKDSSCGSQKQQLNNIQITDMIKLQSFKPMESKDF